MNLDQIESVYPNLEFTSDWMFRHSRQQVAKFLKDLHEAAVWVS